VRIFQLAFTITSLIFSLTTSSAGELRAKVDCGNLDGTMLEINKCAAEQYKIADDELNSLFKKKMATLETDNVKNRLRNSQRAWIAFRDSACLYEAGPREESGSVWPLEYYRCMERHTLNRNDDLKYYISCDTPDCQN